MYLQHFVRLFSPLFLSSFFFQEGHTVIYITCTWLCTMYMPPASKVLHVYTPLLLFLPIRRNVVFIWRHQYRESVAGTLHFHSYLNCSVVPNKVTYFVIDYIYMDYYFVMCSCITSLSVIHFSHDSVLSHVCCFVASIMFISCGSGYIM